MAAACQEMNCAGVDPVDAWRICRLCDVERCVVPSCQVLDAVTPLLEGPP